MEKLTESQENIRSGIWNKNFNRHMNCAYVTINGVTRYHSCEFESYEEFESFAKYWGVTPVKPE